MSEAIISVEGLGKSYRLSHLQQADSFRERITQSVRGMFSRSSRGTSDEIFWALRDISFDVGRGEVLGIIGRNGAGKSTLLKILSRITEPTEGRITIRGRVASLLEVGTGFHPELSGRENIFLNGAILGMSRQEIARKFDEIVAFAEVERFLDTPVKRYSSGMYVRLAFAVAAHLDPEILIVDEVLAVGDAVFQKKCLGKMQDVAGGGKTVLFVSHNLVAVRSLCSAALLLNAGTLLAVGAPGEVLDEYLQSESETQEERRWVDLATAPGDDRLRLCAIRIRPDFGEVIAMETPVRIEIDYVRLSPERRLHFVLHLRNQDETTVTSIVSADTPKIQGRFTAICRIPGNLLNSGYYYFRYLQVEDRSRVTCEKERLVSFHVADDSSRSEGWMGREPGAVHLKLQWEFERIAAI